MASPDPARGNHERHGHERHGHERHGHERHGQDRVPADAVIRTCAAHGWTLAVAESLTGGLVIADLTAVPGASQVVLGGVVAYDAALKSALLDVSDETLEQHGTVSPACAMEMARGMRHSVGAVVAVSTTGVAGPTPSEGHPVGTVHLAVSMCQPGWEEVTATSALHLTGTRMDIRTQATALAVSLLLATLTSESPPSIAQGGGIQ
ncbi:MAG: nicotinamide-nucleotide amidohydrolase family protein [Ornithinimicrobium sp.]